MFVLTILRYTDIVLIMAVVVSLALPTRVAADTKIDEKGVFGLYGDFRVRLESDWDSRSSGGSKRDDRTRMRVRARLGANIKPRDNLSLGFRLRSGSDDSQQSPHITILDFNDNDTGDSDFNFDKWFLKGSHGKASAWVGRNSLPWWKPNEML